MIKVMDSISGIIDLSLWLKLIIYAYKSINSHRSINIVSSHKVFVLWPQKKLFSWTEKYRLHYDCG